MWRCFHSFPAGKKLYTNINYNATYLESEEVGVPDSIGACQQLKHAFTM
jgi:hypothetical protein